MKIKKLFAAFFAISLLTSFFSCSKSDDEFIIGVDGAFPPMAFRSDSSESELIGYDIDLAKEVASRLGLKFGTHIIPWAQKEKELNSGKIDCIWDGLSITPDLLEEFSVTKPYLNNNQIIIVRTDSEILTLSDLEGKVIGYQEETSTAVALDSLPYFKDRLKSLLEFQDYYSALSELENDLIDGVAIDSVMADYILKHTEKPFRILSEPLSPEQFGIAFKKENTDLRDKVQKTLEEMANDGTVAKISTKWFGSDVSIIGK